MDFALRSSLAALTPGKRPPGWSLDTKSDWRHDGRLVGRDSTCSPETPLDQVDAFVPDNGAQVRGTAVMINGIMSDLELQRADLQALANTGLRVVGLHNSTSGMVRDVAQSLGDKMGLSRNKAVDATKVVIENSLAYGGSLHLVAHSQGALIASSALGQVSQDLRNSGLSEQEVEDRLAGVTVTSLGGSAWTYPAGPTYHHHYNRRDFVPLLTGRPFPAKFFGQEKETLHAFSEVKSAGELPPWRNGVSNRVARHTDATVHGVREIYLPRLNA